MQLLTTVLVAPVIGSPKVLHVIFIRERQNLSLHESLLRYAEMVGNNPSLSEPVGVTVCMTASGIPQRLFLSA